MSLTRYIVLISLMKFCYGRNSTEIQIVKSYPDYNTTVELTLNASVEHVLIYPEANTVNPFRVKAWTPNATIDAPVLLVVRQARQVTSWLVPMLVETTKDDNLITFTNTSQTMCHDQMDIISGADSDFSMGTLIISQSFIVALSTSSRDSVQINIDLEEEKDFYVALEKNYSLSVSPSQPRYVYYKFDNNASDTVVITVDSADDVCLIVSVQNSRCPVLDTNKDVKYEGIYQTFNKNGAITIKKTDFRNGFFLVFVARPDNFDCSQENSIIPMPRSVFITPLNVTSVVSFTISNGISLHDYVVACLGTLLALSVFGVVVTICALIFNRFGTVSKFKYVEKDIKESIEPLTDDQIYKILKSETLTLDTLAKYPNRIEKRSFNYLSHVMSIALFYSIPVIQLVVTYQRMVYLTGDQDMCYYNFLCAHPALEFSDFNHIYSNIGYILIGIFFIIAVIDRQTIIKITTDKGIPVHYGLFHAMGVALIIEGLLSACYHICPTQSNYQFDTSFMYIMAVLIMVKLYQNRHPDINATAYTTFTVLGIAIFMATIGILDGSFIIWIAFMVCYSALLIGISFKIYYLNYVLQGLRHFKNCIQTTGFKKDTLKPLKKGRFILIFISNLANYSMLIAGMFLYAKQITDFGTFLLVLLMGNTVIHCIFYTTMKLIHKERICKEAIFYGLLSLAFWVSSGIFFLDAATLWTVTPAESRQWNQGCILLKFYDKHDVWHLLSAPALYFTFMYLMYLDDDLANTLRSEIPVF